MGRGTRNVWQGSRRWWDWTERPLGGLCAAGGRGEASGPLCGASQPSSAFHTCPAAAAPPGRVALAQQAAGAARPRGRVLCARLEQPSAGWAPAPLFWLFPTVCRGPFSNCSISQGSSANHVSPWRVHALLCLFSSLESPSSGHSALCCPKVLTDRAGWGSSCARR